MLNENQKTAVEVRNSNVLVSASAGSGKTKVLITRIANMIINGETDISKLLVVTFTKASAIEMKQRLVAQLTEIREQTTDTDLNQRLLNQIEEINLSDISTIHSFCAKIVRKYFYELNLDPAFKLVEDGLADLKLTAINNVFEYYLNENDKEFEKLYYIFNQKRNNQQLIQTIFKICEILHTTNSRVKDNVNSCFENDLSKNSAINYVNNHIKQLCVQLLTKIKTYISETIITEEKFTEYVSAVINFLNNLSYCDFNQQFNLINEFKVPKNTLKQNKEDYAKIITLLKEELIKPVKELFNGCSTVQDIQQSIYNSKWLTNKLIEVSEKFNSEFYKLKQQKAVLDLSDIETLAIKLLSNQQIKQELQQTYDYIFIDEYQDTNQIQETILTSIAKPKNMFMVGDAKQSIYGFRLCDPTIFCDKYALFQYEGINRKIDLNKNYRSNKDILDFTNMVCSKCITQEVGKVDYAKNAMLETEIDIKPVKDIPSVQIFAIKKPANQKEIVDILHCKPYSVKEAQTNQNNENVVLQTEAKIIANQIASIVGSTLEVNVNNQIQQKVINYSDICILSRTKKGYLQKLSALLNEYEIPVSVVYNDNVYDYFEVQILVNALKTINNFYDDISLTSTLTNLYNFSLEQLVEIKSSSNYKYFYDSVLNFRKETDAALYNKIQEFFKSINALKLKSSYLSVFEILNLILQETQYLTMLSCLKQSKEKIANVNIFINLVKSQNPKSINKFLETLNNSLNKTGKDLSIDNGENSVKLDSIHSSKGLEYPVVILTNCGKDLTTQHSSSPIYFNKDIGISCSAFDTENREKQISVVQNIIKLANSHSEFEENLRLLYVALTRAKNNLIIVGEAQLEKIQPITCSLDNKNCKTYMQLILSSLDKNIIAKINNQNFVQLNNNINLNVVETQQINKNQNLKQSQKKMFVSGELSPQQYQTINNILKFEYPYQQSTNLSIKNSVSQLNHSDDIMVSYNYSPKNLTLNENTFNLQANQIGTAYHTVMQHVNFDMHSENEIKQLLNTLVAENKLSVEEMQSINIQQILDCITEVKKLLQTNSQIKREQPFIMLEKHCNLVEGSELQDEVLVQGVIDLIIINNDKIYIIDYKTNKTNAQKLKELYKKQLQLYQKAASISLNNNDIVGLLYSFYLGKFVTI